MAYARTNAETSGWKSVKRFALVTSILTSIAVLGRYTLDCSAMFFGTNKGEYEQPIHPPLSPKGRFYSAELGDSDAIMQSSDQSDDKKYKDNSEDGHLFDFSREKTLTERVYNTFQYGRDAIDALANVGSNDSKRGIEKSGLEKKVQSDAKFQPDTPSSNPLYQQQSQPSQQQPTEVKTTTSGYSI
ncbi:hypothetical protein J4434_03015 [Candidatus Woesearchaeota archaeon]|nr:hypothetical protein [Candidatus Woesearchaeota archaeon]